MSPGAMLNPVARHRQRCRHVREEMSDYLDGELDERSARQLDRHVRWCPSCRRMLANLRRTIQGLQALEESTSAEPPPGL